MLNKKEQAQKLIQELKERNLIYAISNEEKLIQCMTNDYSMYIGFDPTANSLHLGNYVGMKIIRHFANYGFKTVCVLGGGTGMIGDPSFKKNERPLLTEEQIKINSDKISRQLKEIAKADLIVNNFDFYKNMNVIEFFRDVGKNINVNYLLDKEALKERLKTGLSFTEFTYPLLQGWDFYQLYIKYNTKIQSGGSDQWGNITTGLEIIRKNEGEDTLAAGFTFPLLTNAYGIKFGKSEKNALFLDPEITHPYIVYQFLLNTLDSDLLKYLKALTFLPLNEIQNIYEINLKDLKKKHGQKKLAYTVLCDLYKEEIAQSCEKLSNKLFQNIKSLDNDDFIVLEKTIKCFKTNAKIKITEALVKLELATSLTNARQVILSGGVKIKDMKIIDPNYSLTEEEGAYLLIKKGKHQFGLIKFIK